MISKLQFLLWGLGTKRERDSWYFEYLHHLPKASITPPRGLNGMFSTLPTATTESSSNSSA